MREIRSKGPRGESVRLGWDPGTMQVDFGQADFDYAFGGGRARMHYLPMSFPYSNHEVCEVFADEKDVCVCQGLKDCFERIGGVPPVIVLGNATEAGRRWRDVIVESDLFRRLRPRHGFTARFCNPNAGKEKGNVEGLCALAHRPSYMPYGAMCRAAAGAAPALEIRHIAPGCQRPLRNSMMSSLAL